MYKRQVNGLYYGKGAKGSVRYCIFKENKCAQLGVKGKGRVEVYEGLLHNGPGIGFFCIDQGDALLQFCSIDHHVGVGVLIDQKSQCSLSYCSITHGTQWGLYAAEAHSLKLYSCFLKGNTKAQALFTQTYIDAQYLHVSQGQVGCMFSHCTGRLKGVRSMYLEKAHILMEGDPKDLQPFARLSWVDELNQLSLDSSKSDLESSSLFSFILDHALHSLCLLYTSPSPRD